LEPIPGILSCVLGAGITYAIIKVTGGKGPFSWIVTVYGFSLSPVLIAYVFMAYFGYSVIGCESLGNNLLHLLLLCAVGFAGLTWNIVIQSTGYNALYGISKWKGALISFTVSAIITLLILVVVAAGAASALL